MCEDFTASLFVVFTAQTAFDGSGQTGYEGWTQEQIQQYYAQYGYDYYAQYQQQQAQSMMGGKLCILLYCESPTLRINAFILHYFSF